MSAAFPAPLVEVAINRVLRMDPECGERFAPLDGRAIAVVLEGLDLTLTLRPHADGLRVTSARSAGHGQDPDLRAPDAVISGPPFSVLRFAFAGRAGAVWKAQRSVSVSGDVGVLEQFRDAVSGLHIDIEEQISALAGDVIAHRAVREARSLGGWIANAVKTFHANTGEYLREESRLCVTAPEAERFAAEVDVLRDDIARLAQRVRRLAASCDTESAP